nr:MAG TPA: hypothetical protein [Caudoviricetes sp.]
MTIYAIYTPFYFLIYILLSKINIYKILLNIRTK